MIYGWSSRQHPTVGLAIYGWTLESSLAQGAPLGGIAAAGLAGWFK